MHNHIDGSWASSTYSRDGRRTDHFLILSSDGAFQWSRISADAPERLQSGNWHYDPEEDLLTLQDTKGNFQRDAWQHTVHYVSGCEDMDSILVLRWLAIATPNYPILFRRIDPPEETVSQPSASQR